MESKNSLFFSNFLAVEVSCSVELIYERMTNAVTRLCGYVGRGVHVAKSDFLAIQAAQIRRLTVNRKFTGAQCLSLSFVDVGWPLSVSEQFSASLIR